MDHELAAYYQSLRIEKLGTELEYLRGELGECNPEQFDDEYSEDEQRYHSCDGKYTEFERLGECTELEFKKFKMLQLKQNMLLEYDRLTRKLKAKNEQGEQSEI